METEEGYFIYEWRIENFSHWCAEVHGDCIKTLADPNSFPYCPAIELYPKGISGQGEHLVVRLCGVKHFFPGDLSFHSSDGSLLCKQQVNAERNKNVLELPPGPKLEDVLFRIRESGDFITVRWRIRHHWWHGYERHIRTTINVFKISLKIKPSWIENMKSEGSKNICHLGKYDGMWLKARSENNLIHFMITPPTDFEYPFAIELCMSLTRSDGNVDSCVRKEHIFRDKSPWTFPDPLMDKKEPAGKIISLFLCLKTKNLIQCHYCTNYDHSNVSIELNNAICFSEKAPSTYPVTSSNKVAVLTKDSGSQTSLPFDMPDDSVLSKELMCLYQDQDFSDITLKCDNVSFPVHKNILSARSPVFKTMLSTDMKETKSSEVDIEDLDPSTLSRFLTYLYTGAVEEELQDDSALNLYYAADKYQVPSLKRDCSKFLCANVSISNVCDILSLADRHRDNELTSVSHDFILDNYNAVLKSKEWESFMSSDPSLAVKMLTNFAAKDCVFARKQESK